jgi:hypothetical protein
MFLYASMPAFDQNALICLFSTLGNNVVSCGIRIWQQQCCQLWYQNLTEFGTDQLETNMSWGELMNKISLSINKWASFLILSLLALRDRMRPNVSEVCVS